MARPRGSAIGRYQILGFMARGETSIVYRAVEPDSGQSVALKILPPSAMRDPERVDDFLRVAGRLAALDHANLLPVLDYGREDGLPYVVAPIAQGGSLQEHLGAYDQPALALNLVADLAQAAGYLHHHDIIHGRIEPGHVLLDADGQPLLTGVGRPYPLVGPESAPLYVAPEQRQDEAPDERTDVYQLACLLHHLLLGRPPDPDGEDFAGPQAAGLDQEVAVILVQALAAEPVERFSSAAELADHLVAAGQLQPALQPEPILTRFPRPATVASLASDHSPEPPPVAGTPIADTPAAEPPATEPPVAGLSRPAAPEALVRAMPEPLRDRNPLWLILAIGGLAVLLLLCCALAGYGLYTFSGRFRQPRATAQVDTNVRAGPSTEYTIVGLLRTDEQATIYGISPDGRWWQIAFDGGPGGRGWVPTAFVTVDEPGNVEVVQPPPITPEAALPNAPPPASSASKPPNRAPL